MFFRKFLVLSAALLVAVTSFAQNSIKAVLVDASNGDFVPFATVSLIKDGQTKPSKYVLSSEKGEAVIESVKNGEYTLKAELLGYLPVEKKIKVEGKSIDLGEVKMELDSEQLDAASISAVGNPIVIKKDTIEYNAAAFKTTENDMLEDLLRKLPGVEVDDAGGISVNGESITKITIDGKTFFLNDPTVASQNLPAKLINKLRVIKKKSEQAEFTGIDDGEEENVIDLSVKPGMMNGLMGNFQGGIGHDIPSANNVNDDLRFQANGFLGRFTTDGNLSLILNGNNSNGLGGMMGGMPGGGGMGGGMMGGGSGINTSYMIGANAANNFFDDRMELGGNYNYNHSNRESLSSEFRRTHTGVGDSAYDLVYDTNSQGINTSGNNSFGLRLEHEFSKNTNIMFEPEVSFGTNSSTSTSSSITDYDPLKSSSYKLNEATTNNGSSGKNVSTSGRFIFRQRLGIPGRTLTAQARYSFSNNTSNGTNYNDTKTFNQAGEQIGLNVVDQFYNNVSKSSSVTGNVTYTEPMGNYFYIEGNYSYNWSKSVQDKATFNNADGSQDYSMSNNIVNRNIRQEIGANVLYQSDSFRAQVGFSAQPTNTYNSTTKYDMATGKYEPMEYNDFRWNFSPRAMIFGEFNENSNIRINYRGNSSQPSTSQLMPVPDNSNPLRISFGNPGLTPYFTHNLNVNYRVNNRESFSSLNLRASAGMTQNPIVNAMWYGANGAQYSMPFNGRNTGNASLNASFNTPIAKSNFSINNDLGANWSTSSSYVGSNVDMSRYPDPMTDYYDFMEKFIADRPDLDKASDFENNITNSLSVNERLRMTYRSDALEVILGGNTRMNKTWYSIRPDDNYTRWTNQINTSVTWTYDLAGITVEGSYRYNWYNGYDTNPPQEHILNMEITKLLFNNRITLAVRGYDLLGQSQNLSISDTANYYSETVTNALGRYFIVAVSWRFGSFGGRGGRGGRGGGMRMGGMGGGFRGPM